jgi:phosphoadenosine phosphosulfate reductase
VNIHLIKSNLKEFTNSKKSVLLFTGSSESTVLLAAADPLDINIIFIDTGYHFNEIIDYVKKLTGKVEIIHGKVGSADPASDMKRCCSQRKAAVLKEYLQNLNAECLIVPFRDEDRDNGIEDSYLNNIDDVAIFRPLASLSERDSWMIIKKDILPFSEIYNKGYRSVDCKRCTTRHGRIKPEVDKDIKANKETDEETVQKLKALGYM